MTSPTTTEQLLLPSPRLVVHRDMDGIPTRYSLEEDVRAGLPSYHLNLRPKIDVVSLGCPLDRIHALAESDPEFVEGHAQSWLRGRIRSGLTLLAADVQCIYEGLLVGPLTMGVYLPEEGSPERLARLDHSILFPNWELRLYPVENLSP